MERIGFCFRFVISPPYQQNERFYIIQDIRPCAKHHYLVISKEHIRDCNALTHDDLDLCKTQFYDKP